MKDTNSLVKLSNIPVGQTFVIGDIEYIKFADKDGVTPVVTRDIVFYSDFGENNHFTKSRVFERLNNDFLPNVVDKVGFKNICNITTDLTSLDGLKSYKSMTSKISLPILDFYHENVEIFDKYKVSEWWWLATAFTTLKHNRDNSALCVSPDSFVSYGSCNFVSGVRPLLNFRSSIHVCRQAP